MVDLTQVDPVSGALWDALLDLASSRPDGWTLVGAQMVILHGLQRGRTLARATVDADVLVDVRMDPQRDGAPVPAAGGLWIRARGRRLPLCHGLWHFFQQRGVLTIEPDHALEVPLGEPLDPRQLVAKVA